MSKESFLVMSDQVKFDPLMNQGAAIMAPHAPLFVTSQSKNIAGGRGITLQGDEAKWILIGAVYTTSTFNIPGTILCKISKLNSAHISKKITENGKPVLLVGDNSTQFDAMYTVMSPAINPSTGVTDPVATYTGKGTFLQMNPPKALNKV
jgi:Contractile injection system spike tip protein